MALTDNNFDTQGEILMGRMELLLSATSLCTSRQDCLMSTRNHRAVGWGPCLCSSNSTVCCDSDQTTV